MFRTYSPKDVIVTWGGVLMLGFAEGSLVTVSKSDDDFEMMSGAKGDVVLVGKHNPVGSITVRLQATSPTNDILSSFANTSRKLRPIIQPAFVKNLNSLAPSAKAAFSVLAKVPDIEFDDGMGVREWVILCADLDMFASGSIL